MNTTMITLTEHKLTNRDGFIALFVAYGIILGYIFSRSVDIMELPAANEFKIWILTAVLTLLMAVVSFFLKRLLDSLDKNAIEMRNQLKEHNNHIVTILTTLSHHEKKFHWLETRIERDK